MSDTREAKAIRQEMARIRRHLNEDVEGIVDSARVMSDWRYYVRRYPWLCLGAAAALGYLIVPSRLEVIRPDAESLAKLAKENRLLVKPEPEFHRRGGWPGALFNLLAAAATRGAMAYFSEAARSTFSPHAARADGSEATRR